MCMGMGGGGGAPPPVAAAPVATPAVATQVDPSVLAARQNVRDQAAQNKGRFATIMTSAVSQTLDPQSSQGKTLLGL